LAGEVLINEIMYHAASQDQRDEFIELFNTTPAAINLSGWRFDAGVQYTFPNVSIGAGQYLAVAADLVRFQSMHPGVLNVVGGYTGRLSNSGERVALVNSGGVLVDEVSFAEEGDWGVRTRGLLDHGHQGWIWTAEHDGLGKSLELSNPGLSNDHGQNWTASPFANWISSARTCAPVRSNGSFPKNSS
jgi:CubicO group peptidase (beta-lactamase class C family)